MTDYDEEYDVDEEVDAPTGREAVSGKKGRRMAKPVERDPATDKIILDNYYEEYCKNRVSGFGKSVALRLAKETTGDPERANLGQIAYELEQRPYIKERIEQLRDERMQIAKLAVSREDSLARYHELYAIGLSYGGKEGMNLMFKAQVQIDKILGHDDPHKAKAPDKVESPFMEGQGLDRLVGMIRASEEAAKDNKDVLPASVPLGGKTTLN